MKEVSAQQLLEVMKQGVAFAVFFYTPTCGTCKLAARMIEAVEPLLPGTRVFSCNVNLNPGLVRQWQIRSVPCIARIKDGRLTDLRYRMGGADEIYQHLKVNHQ